MATWNITVPAQSGVGGDGNNSSTITPPGDFDGATINSVSIVGTPQIDSDESSDDSIAIRFNIENSTPAAVYGSTGADADCIAYVNDTFANIFGGTNILAGSAPTPAPTTAVASDWANVHWQWTYSQAGMPDNSTLSWSSWQIAVDYTPAAPEVNKTFTGTGSVALAIQKSLSRSLAFSGSATLETLVYGKPRVWLNSTATKTGATAMTVTAWAPTSITFNDPSGAPTGSLQLGVERLDSGVLDWIAVTVTENGNFVTANIPGVGTLTLTKEVQIARTYSGTGSSTIAKAVGWLRSFAGTGTSALIAARTFLRSFTFTGTGTPTLARAISYLRSFTFDGTGTSTVSKQVGLLFSYAGTGTSAVAKQMAQAFSYAGAGAAVLATSAAQNLSFAFTGTGTPDLTTLRGLVLSFTATAGVALQKVISVARNATGAGTSVVQRTIGISKSATGTGSVLGEQSNTPEVQPVMTGTGTGSVSKQVGLPRSFGGAATSSIQKQAQLPKDVSATGSTQLETQGDVTVEANVSATGTAQSAQGTIFQRILNSAATGTVTLSRRIGKVFNYVGVGITSLIGDGITPDSGRGILRLLLRPLLREKTRDK